MQLFVPVTDTNHFAGTHDSTASKAKESTSQEEFVLIEKLKLGPTIIPTQEKQSSQDDVVLDSPKNNADDVVHIAKLVNEEPILDDVVKETVSSSNVADSAAAQHSASQKHSAAPQNSAAGPSHTTAT